MNSFIVAFLLFAQALTAFKVGDFVRIQGVNSELNGGIGVIEAGAAFTEKDPQHERYTIHFIHEGNLAEFVPGESKVKSFLKSTFIKEENLIPLEANYFSHPDRYALDKMKVALDVVTKKSDAFLGDESARRKARLIGAWIDQHGGFQAMVYVNDRFSGALKRCIEFSWHGIGEFRG